MTISNYRSFTNIFIVFLIIFFSTNVYSVSELFSVEVDENIAEINTKDLKKLKTINMERLLFGKATLGFYSDGTIFEAVYSPNSSDQKGEYSALFNENQEFKGIYKIAQSKICYLPDGSDDWQCSILYKHKKIDGIYYWAQKGKIFAKIVKVMEIPEYKKMKFDHSEAEKVRRAEEKRLAEEKRIAEEKRLEEIKIVEQKAEEEKRIAEEKKAAELKSKFSTMKDEQKSFVSAVEEFKANLKEIKNDDLKLGVTLTKRNQKLINILPNPQLEYYDYSTGKKTNTCSYDLCNKLNTISVRDWIGIIYKLHTTLDGYIYPQIAMPSLTDINIPTKNYLSAGSGLFASDSGYNYLIKPDNRLYDIVAGYSEKDRVLISGEFFIDNDTGYPQTEEWMKKNQLGKPEFTFRFTNIQKIN